VCCGARGVRFLAILSPSVGAKQHSATWCGDDDGTAQLLHSTGRFDERPPQQKGFAYGGGQGRLKVFLLIIFPCKKQTTSEAARFLLPFSYVKYAVWRAELGVAQELDGDASTYPL